MSKLFIFLTLLLVPMQVLAQADGGDSRVLKEAAAAELESVLVDAVKLEDKLALITVRAQAAGLISLSNPDRAELMFRDIWNFVKLQDEKDFDKEKGRTLILKHVFQRNRKLAKQLLAEEPKAAETSLITRAKGQDTNGKRIAKLASELVYENPRAASELLEQSLAKGVTVAGLNVLLRLRERDALISDYVTAKAIDGLRPQPDLLALGGLHLLLPYVFPEGGHVELTFSLQSLQSHYFSAAYDVLTTSLIQSEVDLMKSQRYTRQDLKLRAMYQALVALTLSALAHTYQPSLGPELTGLAAKLGPRLPPDVALMAKFTTARLSGMQEVPANPELAISLALQNGDLEKASEMVDELKDSDQKAEYTQLLAKLGSRALLSKGDVVGALARIRKVEDSAARLVLYIEALKAAETKSDSHLTNAIIDEARGLIHRTDQNGLDARALLVFATQVKSLRSTEEAIEFLSAAVVAINSLSKSPTNSKDSSPSDLAWAQINDPLTLLEAPEFGRAFSSVGASDLERGIMTARRITVKPLQLIARLHSISGVLKSEASKPRQTPARKN